MRTVKLLSWALDIETKSASLKQARLTLDFVPLVRKSAVVGELARLDPAALVLDMDKLPSNSREIALMLRASKSARHIPILLAGSLEAAEDGGLPQKYARLRSELPDLVYASWPEAKSALAKLLKRPPAPHLVPPPRTYTASLAQKLGVLPGTSASGSSSKSRSVALIAAPDRFIDLLGDLPAQVKLSHRLEANTLLAVCFIRTLGDLAPTLDMLTLQLPPAASAWIAYPKRATGSHRDFSEKDVRNLSLAAGFVDYKICSIDASGSAMKFARRKRP